jgi:hypothetical protein
MRDQTRRVHVVWADGGSKARRGTAFEIGVLNDAVAKAAAAAGTIIALDLQKHAHTTRWLHYTQFSCLSAASVACSCPYYV